MSSAEFWLIDGWNVVHGLSGRKSSLKSAISSDKLLSILADFSAHAGCRMRVIWDGHGPGGTSGTIGKQAHPKALVSSFVESIYSADQTADAILERYLYEHREAASFVVVTDDVAMSRIARGSGARVFSVARLAEMIAEQSKERRDETDRTRADAHGFNRPFDEKLRKKGWT